MSRNAHVRCEVGENPAIISNDYLSLFPKIESAEMMFSASRSRRLQIVPIIQSFSQLDKNYGKEGSEIIVDNTQVTLFGGFAPNSSSAETLSKALGSRTVMSGSVSLGKDNHSESLQMMERPLLTPDELRNLPKGDFVVMKTGVHPMRVHLKLFFKWGIQFDEEHPFTVRENGNRTVAYANKAELMFNIKKKYDPEAFAEPVSESDPGGMPDPEQTKGSAKVILRTEDEEQNAAGKKNCKSGGTEQAQTMAQPTPNRPRHRMPSDPFSQKRGTT